MMESENNSVGENVSKNPHAPSSQVSGRECIKDIANNREGNGRSVQVQSGYNINNGNDPKVTTKGWNSCEIDFINRSETTENSIHSALRPTSFQAELGFEDQVDKTETSRCKLPEQCQKQHEGNLVSTLVGESEQTSDDQELARHNVCSKTASSDGGMTTKMDEDDLEEGEVKDSEMKDTPSLEQTFPQICSFYRRGKCSFGNSCKFLHPHADNKGNYSMFSPVQLPPPPLVLGNRFPKRFVPCLYDPTFLFPKVMPCVSLRALPINETPLEWAWERDLNLIKELMIKCKRKKLGETNFREERGKLKSNENYKMKKGWCKIKTCKHNPCKVKNKVCRPCKNKTAVSVASDGEKLRKNSYIQSKPICKIRSLRETDKSAEKQSANTKLSVGNKEINERFGLSTVGPRSAGQNNSSIFKYEKTARKRLRSISRSSRSLSRSDERPAKLVTEKKPLLGNEVTISPHKMRFKTKPGLSVPPSESHSTIGKHKSSKHSSKLHLLPITSEQSKNTKATCVPHSKGNVYQPSDHEAKKHWPKSSYESMSSKKPETRTTKLNSSTSTSSYSVSGPRMSSAQRKLLQCPKLVSSVRGLLSECLPSPKALPLAAGYRSLRKSSPKSRLSKSLSMSSISSVSSTKSSSSSGSVLSTKTRAPRSSRDKMMPLIRYSKQRYNERHSVGTAKDKHPVRPHKQERRKVAFAEVKKISSSTAKDPKCSYKHMGNVVMELPNKVSPLPKQKEKLAKQVSDIVRRRGASKLDSTVLSPRNKPNVKCFVREHSSRKEKLLGLIKAIDEAIARKRNLLKIIYS